MNIEIFNANNDEVLHTQFYISPSDKG